MKLTALIHRLAAAAFAVAFFAGCAAGPDKGSDASPPGYIEFEHGGTIYVVGSMMSARKVQSGELLSQRITAHTAQGQPMIIEGGEPGLDTRLMAEYHRRHAAR